MAWAQQAHPCSRASTRRDEDARQCESSNPALERPVFKHPALKHPALKHPALKHPALKLETDSGT